MGVRLPSVASTTIVANVPVAGSPGVIATVGPMNLILDNAQVILLFTVMVTPGAAVTFLAAQLRRGTLITSPLINVNLAEAVTAGANTLLSGSYVDSPGAAGGLFYSLTVQATGGAAVSVVSDVSLIAMCL